MCAVMSGEKTYEMNWDCEYCGTKQLLGKTHQHCPECGAPQNPEKRYFPPDDQKVAVQDHQYVGADVHCPACRHAQSAAVKFCANCGSPMDGGKAAHRQADQVVGPDGVVQPPPGAAPPTSGGGGGKGVFIVLGLLLVAVIGFFVVRSMWTEEASVEVTKLSWKREIVIEKNGSVKEDGPCKDMPKGAEELSRKTPKPTCKTRKIDQGDGTFKEKKECEEAVEQCTYRVTKWTEDRRASEEGGVDDDPTWPKVKLRKEGTCEGCERQGDKVESYIVHFEDEGGDEKRCTFRKASEWKKFDVGSKWKGDKRVMGGDLDCDSLKKQ